MDIGKEKPAVVVTPVKLPYPLTKREKPVPAPDTPVRKEPAVV